MAALAIILCAIPLSVALWLDSRRIGRELIEIDRGIEDAWLRQCSDRG